MSNPERTGQSSWQKKVALCAAAGLVVAALVWHFKTPHPVQPAPSVQPDNGRAAREQAEEARRKAEAESKQAVAAAEAAAKAEAEAKAKADAEQKVRDEAEAIRRAAAEQAWASTADMFDTVIARGDGFVIKRSHLDRALSALKVTTSVQGRSISPAELRNAEHNLLDFLIQVQLFNQKATDAEKARGMAEGNKRFQEIKQRAPSEQALARQLKAVDWSLDQFHDRLVEEATAQAVLLSKIKVSDDQVREYYQQHAAEFEVPEMVRVSHILFFTGNPYTGVTLTDAETAAKKTRLEDLRQRANSGEDFATLAQEYSEDPSVKVNGGEVTLEHGGHWPLGAVPPEVEAAAFTLKPGQISYVINSALGFHLVKVDEKMPAHRAEFDRVSARIRDRLETKESERILPGYYRQLKQDTHVEILDERLRGLEAEAEKSAGPRASAGN